MSNWISSIDDETLLVDLAIPGTHDSASWTHDTVSWRNFTWTQRLNFTEQLELGIRAFDLRVSWKHWGGEDCGVNWFGFDCRGSEDIAMKHGPRQVNNQTLDDVLAEIKAWLDENTTEFVILMFQQQGVFDCSEKLKADVNKHFSGDRFFSYSPHHMSWPTVRFLRNKVMVMERLKSRVAGWYDISAWKGEPTGELVKIPKHLSIYLQDKYQNVSDKNMYYNTMEYEAKRKMEVVKAAAEKIIDDKRVLRINHTSYSNKRWQPYESGEVVNTLLCETSFQIQGVMMIDNADDLTINHILQYNPF